MSETLTILWLILRMKGIGARCVCVNVNTRVVY